jgi:DNA invertase Pin-like site-specific DNA recombinase
VAAQVTGASWILTPDINLVYGVGFAPYPSAADVLAVVHAVLGGLAEFERELIRSRTGEGRARAVARGLKIGRKPKLTAHRRKESIRISDQDESAYDIARSHNVHNGTISRLAAWP